MARSAPNPDLTPLFAALADRTRLRLLNLMNGREVCVCYFVEILRQSQPKISRHLAYLRRAGIVSARREGKWMHYRIERPVDPGALAILEATLAPSAPIAKCNPTSTRLTKACCQPRPFVTLRCPDCQRPSPQKLSDRGPPALPVGRNYSSAELLSFCKIPPQSNTRIQLLTFLDILDLNVHFPGVNSRTHLPRRHPWTILLPHPLPPDPKSRHLWQPLLSSALRLGGYAIHEHNAAQELAAQNAQQNATLDCHPASAQRPCHARQ